VINVGNGANAPVFEQNTLAVSAESFTAVLTDSQSMRQENNT